MVEAEMSAPIPSCGSTKDNVNALLQTVRALDQTGPGERGEVLAKLWKCLANTSGGPFHAAEQSALRWLLKIMNPPASNQAPAAAELVQRFPLTWRIIECIFRRVPLFSLAKALADRKFVAVLRQTLERACARPKGGDGLPATPGKRKRWEPAFELEELRCAEGCLWTAHAVFGALGRLIDRVREVDADAGSERTHERIGAEHVKSLLCLPAAESLKIVGPLMNLCLHSLLGRSLELPGDRTDWMRVACSTWDLRLQGAADAIEVAMQLTRPACRIFRELVASPTPPAPWKENVGMFIRHDLIRPSRAEFLHRKTTDVLATAMEITRSQAHVTGPVLHAHALQVYRDLGSRASAADDDWIRLVFRIVEGPIRESKTADLRREAMAEIICGTKGLGSAIGVADLQAACREYALGDSRTDWGLLRDVAELDHTVFFGSQTADDLLGEVFGRIGAVDLGTDSEESEAIIGVAVSIVRGFCTARNLQGFFKKWYEALALPRGDRKSRLGLWYDERIRAGPDSPLVSELEERLSPQQLLAILEWIGKGKDDVHAAAVVTVASAVADGITSEQYVDAVGTKLYDLVSPHLKPGRLPDEVSCLGWRTVAKSASWLTCDQATDIWEATQKRLGKVLDESPLETRTTFEAFRCACQLWASMYPEGGKAGEACSRVVAVVDRVAAGIVLRWDEHPTSALPRRVDLRYDEGRGLRSYLDLAVYGPVDVVGKLAESQRTLPDVVQKLAEKCLGTEPTGAENPLGEILDNQATVDNASFVGPLIARLIKSTTPENEGGPRRMPTPTVISLLSRIPTEAYSRGQRALVMEILRSWCAHAASSRAASPDSWKRVLGLMIKMMSRPTFPARMRFRDLVDVANGVGSAVAAAENSREWESDGLSELVLILAQRTVRQMAAHPDDRSAEYFAGAGQAVRDLFGKSSETEEFMNLRLLEALYTCIPGDVLAKLPEATQCSLQEDALETVMARGIEAYASAYVSKKRSRRGPAARDRLFVALEAAACMRGLGRCTGIPVKKLERAGDEEIAQGAPTGWRVKAFLIARFGTEISEPRPTRFGHAGDPDGTAGACHLTQRACVAVCVRAVLSGMNAEEQLGYLWDLLRELDSAVGRGRETQMLAIRRTLQVLMESDVGDRFADNAFAAVHADLAARLRSPATQRELDRVAGLVHMLLDGRPGAMTQWSIESTLTAIAVLCSRPPTGVLAMYSYPKLCRLVETLLKKHRIRLEGHYHLVTTTLIALLRAFLATPESHDAPPLSSEQTESHAHRFARLVTMLCEPAVGAVSRRHHHHHQHDNGPAPLDSATDKTKRSAGRHVYVVLTAYVQVVLSGARVGRGVRDALEPGWNSLLDVTGPETRRILNDGLDEGGREVVKELWKRYTMFGKWTGV